MSNASPSPSGRRGALNRDRILDEALALVDANGLQGLTMRRLGAALRADPMAVYYHFGGKHAIVLALVERVFAGFTVPAPANASWDERVRVWAHSYRRLAIAHQGLILNVLGDPAAVAIAAGRANQPLSEALADAGMAPAAVEASIIALADYVHGAVLPMAAYPGQAHDFDPAFEAGLDIILAGIAHAAGQT